ncbi:hypothetical protein KUTeg_007138 [Tegillarca granosa]|uniref:Uncharacterized protein n=1 Tax=Tegillarca granosa TaxID=220873 RepID=A0ABQ9FCD0_TEGGR|nr:hypothetical protein KUTeg_007138 [Tegillarca granosa]
MESVELQTFACLHIKDLTITAFKVKFIQKGKLKQDVCRIAALEMAVVATIQFDNDKTQTSQTLHILLCSFKLKIIKIQEAAFAKHDPEDYDNLKLSASIKKEAKQKKRLCELYLSQSDKARLPKTFSLDFSSLMEESFIQIYHSEMVEVIGLITTGAFRDPLLSQGRQRSAEDRTILRCLTGYEYTDKDIEQVKLPPLPLVPLGRHGTDSIKWLQMPLHNIESTPRMASRKRMLGIFNKGNVNFVEWSQVPVDTVMQIDKEMQLQKKRMYKETPPFRKVYFHPARQPQPPPSPPSIQEKCAESGQDINNIDSSVKIPESIGSTHVEQPPMSQPEPTHVTWPEPKPAIPELVTENTMMSVPPT